MGKPNIHQIEKSRRGYVFLDGPIRELQGEIEEPATVKQSRTRIYDKEVSPYTFQNCLHPTSVSFEHSIDS